jgi:hypothetical protein
MVKNPVWKCTLVVLISVLVAFCDGGSGSGNHSSTPQVISLDPEVNDVAVLLDSNIMATFNQNMNSGDSSTFSVHGSMSGKLLGTYSGDGTAVLTFDPNNIFKPGEEVEVTLTAGLTATDGVSLASPLVYRFLTEVNGTGNANFVSAAIFAVGDTPRSLTAGDLDGDADLDLAVANQNGFDVTVLLNDGGGGFSEAAGSPVAVGNQPRDITASDFDGDEDLDLAVANFFDNNVTVLLNDGNAGFGEAAGSPFSVGALAASLTTGDLDGDGDLDLTVVNRNDNNITVLLNDGSAGFSEAAGSPFSVGNLPQAITTGDLDGDGDLDLIVTDTSGPSLTVMLNDGDGDFSEAPGSPILVGAGPLSLTAKDFDRDGDLDMGVANFFDNNVTVLLNDGTGGFSEALGSPVATGSEPDSLTAGDLDEDEDLDLTMTNRADNNITVLLNDGSAGFSEAAGSPFSVGNLPQAITTGDLDEDGDLDLAVAIPNTNLELLINQP